MRFRKQPALQDHTLKIEDSLHDLVFGKQRRRVLARDKSRRSPDLVIRRRRRCFMLNEPFAVGDISIRVSTGLSKSRRIIGGAFFARSSLIVRGSRLRLFFLWLH